jgi:hypothetical protein
MTTKDRSMATGPYPTRCTMRLVRVEGSWSGGAYRTRVVGQRAILTMSDGSEVECCASPNGHKKHDTLVACASAKVAELNEAAGIPEAVR